MAQARGQLVAARYREAVAASQSIVRSRLDTLFAEHDLDGLVAPANAAAEKIDWARGDVFSVSSSRFAALSGRPGIVVPGGMIGELPVGIAFVGEDHGDARLVEIAAVFERMRGAMPAPKFLPRAEL
jgi:amidase